jgi:hypothetical protein
MGPESRHWFARKLGYEHPEEMPFAVDIPVAGQPYDLSRTQSYRAAAKGVFGPLIIIGGRKKVSTMQLMKRVLGEAAN